MMFDDRRQENFLKPFLAEPLKIDEQKMEHDIETNNVKHEEIKGLDFKPKVYTKSVGAQCDISPYCLALDS